MIIKLKAQGIAGVENSYIEVTNRVSRILVKEDFSCVAVFGGLDAEEGHIYCNVGQSAAMI